MHFALLETKDVHAYNAVLNTCERGALSRVSPECSKWTIHWGPHPPPEMLKGLHPFQKVNHFPASFHLGRKDLLWKNVHRMKRQFPKHFDIMPAGFTMPEDAQAWAAARESNPSALWIYKPVCGSCGKGIRLFDS